MRRVFMAFAALLLVLGVVGCGEADPTPGVEDSGLSGLETGAEAERAVLVLGRSVMTGWVEHWGGDGSGIVSWSGHTITFREIEGPPGIARSAADAIAEAPAGSTVLFKFCFIDFNGGEYADELDTYMRYIAEVTDAASVADVHLILGTALPRVRGETTPDLIEEHREFGRMLEAFAAERRDAGQPVAVLDLNGILTDGGGALERGYAVSPDDSHLNDDAYDALDAELLKLLDERD